MKKMMIKIPLLICILLAFLFIGNRKVSSVLYLGCPTASHYTSLKARNPWDMTVHSGVLYIGAGDFGENTGQTPIFGYDTGKQVWSITSFVQDESVAAFVPYKNTVCAPGIDALTSWEYGNYHILNRNGTWDSVTNLPNAVHNFDLTEYKDAIFYAIGTGNNQVSPVKKSTDDGKTYQDIPFYDENGIPLIGTNQYDATRVYQFIHIQDELYCFFVGLEGEPTKAVDTAFFHYDGIAFRRVSLVRELGLRRKGIRQTYFGNIVSYGNEAYLTSGYAYKTSDCKTFTYLETPEGGLTSDLLKDGKAIYILNYIPINESEYTNIIWQYTPNSGTFKEVFRIRSKDAFALSFAKHQDTFYIGFGHGSNAGQIIQVSI